MAAPRAARELRLPLQNVVVVLAQAIRGAEEPNVGVHFPVDGELDVAAVGRDVAPTGFESAVEVNFRRERLLRGERSGAVWEVGGGRWEVF